MKLRSTLPYVRTEHIIFRTFDEHYLLSQLVSWRLSKSERIRIIRRALHLLTSTMQVYSLMGIDYALYWLLSTIRYYGLKQAGFDGWYCNIINQVHAYYIFCAVPPVFTIQIIGMGLIADFVHGLVDAFSTLVDSFHIDPKPCLPVPSPPNLMRYAEIFVLLTLVWFMLFFEAYVLRMRQVVMNRYHPDRSRERAGWLYQQIVRKRMSFVKFARRKVRRRFHKDGFVEQVRFMDWVRAKLDQ